MKLTPAHGQNKLDDRFTDDEVCGALHPVSGVQCQFSRLYHPATHCAIYSVGEGRTAITNWPVVTPFVEVVEAPRYRIVSASQKRMLIAGIIIGGVAITGLLLYGVLALQRWLE